MVPKLWCRVGSPTFLVRLIIIIFIIKKQNTKNRLGLSLWYTCPYGVNEVIQLPQLQFKEMEKIWSMMLMPIIKVDICLYNWILSKPWIHIHLGISGKLSHTPGLSSVRFVSFNPNCGWLYSLSPLLKTPQCLTLISGVKKSLINGSSAITCTSQLASDAVNYMYFNTKWFNIVLNCIFCWSEDINIYPSEEWHCNILFRSIKYLWIIQILKQTYISSFGRKTYSHANKVHFRPKLWIVTILFYLTACKREMFEKCKALTQRRMFCKVVKRGYEFQFPLPST